MSVPLFKRRTIWWPTPTGWLALTLSFLAPAFVWCFKGESFLALTERQPADVLVVEGWIGIEGIMAAKAEFEKGGYHYIVTTSGLRGNVWDSHHWSYALEAQELLLRLGVPPEKVILATPKENETHRTFSSACASRLSLEARGIHAHYINVFTHEVHARRSRLVFAKVFGADTNTGVIAWSANRGTKEQWWHSSNRALELMKETVGYFFELLLNSGRWSNSAETQNSKR